MHKKFLRTSIAMAVLSLGALILSDKDSLGMKDDEEEKTHPKKVIKEEMVLSLREETMGQWVPSGRTYEVEEQPDPKAVYTNALASDPNCFARILELSKCVYVQTNIGAQYEETYSSRPIRGKTYYTPYGTVSEEYTTEHFTVKKNYPPTYECRNCKKPKPQSMPVTLLGFTFDAPNDGSSTPACSRPNYDELDDILKHILTLTPTVTLTSTEPWWSDFEKRLWYTAKSLDRKNGCKVEDKQPKPKTKQQDSCKIS